MNTCYCQKCKRTMPVGNFGKRSDGTPKGWCNRCCNRQSKTKIKMYKRRKETGKGPDPRNGKSYSSRNYILKVIGFTSYQEYLRSDLWADIRNRVFTHKGDSCHLCKKPASQVHHTRYTKATLLGKKMKYLIPICGDCHYTIEFQDSKKLTVRRSVKKFTFIDRQRNGTVQTPPALVQSQ